VVPVKNRSIEAQQQQLKGKVPAIQGQQQRYHLINNNLI